MIKILGKNYHLRLFFSNFKPAVYLTRKYSLICFAIKYDHIQYIICIFSIKMILSSWVWHRTHIPANIMFALKWLIVKIWINIFLMRMQKLGMMFGEGDLILKRVRYLKCYPALVWLFYEDFVKRIWIFIWDFLRFLGNLDSYTSGFILTVASFWAEM